MERKKKWVILGVEPPGLFRGRGEHPKIGRLKDRIRPEDIIINIGKSANIPSPPKGHKWGKVIHDNTVTWLAFWKENINDNYKYVFLSVDSDIRNKSDIEKYEKARRLKKYIKKVRRINDTNLKSSDPKIMQLATALYLIDNLALRAGNEKDADEADTVGCCSLRLEHLDLKGDCILSLDFLGKDSVRYQNESKVNKQVCKNLKKLIKGKKDTDKLFDLINTNTLNRYISNFMKGFNIKGI